MGSFKKSILAIFFWVMLALLFDGFLWLYFFYYINIHIANQKALDFLTGFLIEKSLSIDNLFVFYLIFSECNLSILQQKKVLTLGIWGAIVFRLFLILLGSYLVSQYHWLLYFMGAFLFLTGIKMLLKKKVEKNKELKLINNIKKIIPIVTMKNNQYFVRYQQKWHGTQLLLALILIELSDLFFAFDSIPAIFAITKDPFIVWTSNVFAILGLRNLYFVLATMIERFFLIKYAIALILAFVGIKMMIEPWVMISNLFSLAVITSLLLIFLVINFLIKKR